MKILYHLPSPHTIYAGRTIYNGYRNAFLHLGHEFQPFTSDDSLARVLESFNPNIFITASHFYYLRFLDHRLLKYFRDAGLFVFVWIDAWISGVNRARVNEARSLKDNGSVLALLKDGLLGDVFLQGIEHCDERMRGFENSTGVSYHTVPLAADHTTI